ncbi:MAG: PLP-dependent aminotransferase family protein [Pseudomonadota bacterium]
MALPVETFFLSPLAKGTLQNQVQQMVAHGILSGRFAPGEKLPSSRKLAAHLGLSRITVTLAYTELVASDYLTAKGRSGYYVSHTAPIPPSYQMPDLTEDTIDWSRAIGQRFADAGVALRPPDWDRFRFPFIYGQTDPQLFDHANWRTCAMQALGQRDFSALTADYYDRDDPQLIGFIQRNTLPRRGISATPEQILITMGAQNALWLTAQVLLTQRRTAAFEDPGYPALRDILTQSRCHLAPVRVDAGGLPPDALPDETDVIFCAPSHHCPSTVTMPMDRRTALLDRARALDALVVEDDYEFEMSTHARPSPALKSIDREGRVIYVGSFSKSLFPGLRLGYLVGSESFIREVRALRTSVLRHPPGHIQRTAAYFLSLGHYDAQIRKMGAALQDRRAAMQAAIAQHGLRIAGADTVGGSSFWMQAPEGVDTARLARKLEGQSVLIEPGHPFFATSPAPRHFYRLGYSSIPTSRIDEGIARIAAAERALLD